MRTTFFHLLSLMMILAFSTSCGKDESKKTHQPVHHSSLNVDLSGAAALNNLTAWYNSPTEGAIPNLTNGLVARAVTRSERTVSTSSNCDANPIKIFGTVIGQFNVCNSSSSSNTGTQSFKLETMLQGGDKKINNPNLSAAMASVISQGANGLYLTNITQSRSFRTAGVAFVLTFTNSNNQVVVHVIDTGYNSRVNPSYTYDGVNGKETTLMHVQEFIY